MKLVLTQLARETRGTHNVGAFFDRLGSLEDLALGANDIVLLPEVVSDMRDNGANDLYQEELCAFAKRLGCHVVGGSHFWGEKNGDLKNVGLVVAPDGNVHSRFEKKKLYSGEREFVAQGTGPQDCVIGPCRIRTFICADFFYSDFHALPPPDLILVAALSTSRKPEPHFSRAVWQHMAVSKAYEFGAFVGISDWAYKAHEHPSSSGVAGFADPTQHDPSSLFTALGDVSYAVHTIDLDALSTLRQDRHEQGFLNYI